VNPRKLPRILLLTLGYGLLVQVAFVFSLELRFGGEVPAGSWRAYANVAPLFTVLSLAAYLVSGLYHGLWRYAGTATLFQILKGVTLSALALLLVSLFGGVGVPRSVVVLVWLWQLVLMGGARLAWRLWRERALDLTPLHAVRALVLGAGPAGVHLAQEMRSRVARQEALEPVGFVDEDVRLRGRLVEGVEVLGTIADLPRILERSEAALVIVSDPDLPGRVVRDVARHCADRGVRVKTLPGLADLRPGHSALAQVRDVSIEDLLGRVPVELDSAEVAGFLRGQRVLVTGAGGSIGAELVRQAAAFAPAEIALIDHAENGLYFIQDEMRAAHRELSLRAFVVDICDLEGVETVHARFRPTVVLHAAAHKHVPLLESNPRAAVLNNVVGTRIMLDAAERHGVGKFVFVSTDKAVNPASVMGATKRIGEMLMQSRSGRSRTRFVAVRFGNVLGSEGSVIPLFQRQIQRGGPLTVTHPDVRRYFMLIAEAARLVLQAGAMGRGGEVFLLEMGEPVRIADLARQLVRLAGLREGEDVAIVYTGLRPGEKLEEELHSRREATRITRHQRILAWDLEAPSEADLLEAVARLEACARGDDEQAIRRELHRIVPEYRETDGGAPSDERSARLASDAHETLDDAGPAGGSTEAPAGESERRPSREGAL